MPMINIEDAYILEETGEQVDQVTGLYFKNEDASDTEKAQARANIGAGGSNDNLLDNAYFVGGGSQLGDGIFPINQRGTTFYSLSWGNIFDRWHIQGSATSTCTLNANGIAFATDTENCGLSQTIPAGRIVDGKTYTLSVMDTAGNIYSGSRVLNTNDSWQNFDLGLSAFGWYNPCYVAANGQTNVYILDRTGSGGSASIGLAAAKLELGTVSTLANDVPPNFFDEKKRCQSFLWHKTFPQYTQIGTGVATDANNCVIDVVLPASMRTGATITFTANVLLIGAGGAVVAASVSAINIIDNHARLNVIAASSMVAHNTYSFITTAETTMTISAEI